DGIRDKLVTGVQTCALPIYRELHRAETCGKVTAARADAVDQERAQLGGQRRELACRQAPQIRRRLDRAEQRVVVGRWAHRRLSEIGRACVGKEWRSRWPREG